MRGFHKRGVSCLAFFESGSFLASIGLDDDHSIGIYELNGFALIASSKCDKSNITSIAVSGDDRIVTVGNLLTPENP